MPYEQEAADAIGAIRTLLRRAQKHVLAVKALQEIEIITIHVEGTPEDTEPIQDIRKIVGKGLDNAL